ALAAGHALGARAVATDEAEVEIALAPAEPLCGVARLGGRPASGARIAWSSDDGVRWPTAWCNARADAQGRFELPRPADGTLALEARADGALAATTLDLDAGPAWWTAELGRADTLSVRLLEPDGRPAVGLYLCLREAGGGSLLGAVECDDEGCARFEPHRPGPYDLVVLPPRGAGGWPREVLRELSAGGGERLLRLGPAPEHTSALEVRFDAAAGARLELRHLASGIEEHADATADGRLVWRALPAGRWSARAQFADGGARDLGEFTLEAGCTLDLGAIE
ncbi:MAG TPA: hypothetical protein VMT18_07395, partial [Planctomycetota bacterium]|nr:hypothetical protein [Planctomycetota bacterium]